MKNLLLFSWSEHCSNGGFNDFICDYENINELFSSFKNRIENDSNCLLEVYQILSISEMKIIEEGYIDKENGVKFNPIIE
ncbi:MAG TPA: hypothetical protein VIH28_08440 [Ignavibacteriaceae bacterium]